MSHLLLTIEIYHYLFLQRNDNVSTTCLFNSYVAILCFSEAYCMCSASGYHINARDEKKGAKVPASGAGWV